MRNVLEDLYFGEVGANTFGKNENPRLKKAVQIVDETEALLMQLLEGKENEFFRKYANAQGEVNGSSAVENFIAGFKLGARIMLEAAIA